MHWSTKYLMIQFREMNCTEFIEHVLRDHFQREYSFPQSRGSIFQQSLDIKEGLPQYCEETDDPQDGDVVLMNGLRSLCHVGLYVKYKGVDYVFHCEKRIGRAVMHRFSEINGYGYSIAGVYKWVK